YPLRLSEQERVGREAGAVTFHSLAVDDGDRGRPESHLQEFLQGRLIRTDILVDERKLVSRKKLFLFVTGTSARLGKDNHGYSHTLTSRKKYRSFLYHLPLELAKPANTRFPFKKNRHLVG
ncbi:MAG: hypothetical protein AAB222_02215, partial [Candidatus Binatota bacterium]